MASLQIDSFMHKGLISTNANESVMSVTCTMKENRIGAIAITDDAGKIIGMFSERDLVNKVIPDEMDLNTTKMETVMTSPVITIENNKTAQDAVLLMNDNKIRHLPVVNSEGVPIGMLGIRDIMSALMQQVIDDFMSK